MDRCALIMSTRILGRRTAPFTPFLIPNRVPHGFTQDPSTDKRGAQFCFVDGPAMSPVVPLPRLALRRRCVVPLGSETLPVLCQELRAEEAFCCAPLLLHTALHTPLTLASSDRLPTVAPCMT